MSRPTLPQWVPTWNRKLHIYIGLYFLFFIWTFALSGLILNHPQWTLSQFWPRRVESSVKHPFRPLTSKGDFEKAGELVRQLEITGEIEQVKSVPAENRLDVQIVRPGRMVTIQTNLVLATATVKTIQTDGWGIFHMLHTFNGVRMEDPERTRDWIATTLWVVSMDALCLGLIFLILSSLYMWYLRKDKWRTGLIALCAGVFCCGFFAFGLSWIY